MRCFFPRPRAARLANVFFLPLPPDFPILPPLCVKILGLCLYPGAISKTLKEGGDKSLFAAIKSFLGEPREHDPIEPYKVLLKADDPVYMRYLYQTDDSDQDRLFPIVSNMMVSQNRIAELEAPMAKTHNNCLLVSSGKQVFESPGSTIDMTSKDFRWRMTAFMFFHMKATLKRIDEHFQNNESFVPFPASLISDIAWFLPKTDYTSRAVHRASGAEGVDEEKAEAACHAMRAYVDTRIIRLQKLFSVNNIPVGADLDLRLSDISDFDAEQEPDITKKYATDFFNESARYMLSWCDADYEIRKTANDVLGLEDALPNCFNFAEIEVRLVLLFFRKQPRRVLTPARSGADVLCGQRLRISARRRLGPVRLGFRAV